MAAATRTSTTTSSIPGPIRARRRLRTPSRRPGQPGTAASHSPTPGWPRAPTSRHATVCPCQADPVLLSTGEMTETIIDYQTAGANKLGFTRYYNMLPNSFTGVSGLPTILAATLGPNWRNSYDRYLQLVSTNNQLTAIVAERANRQLLSFGWNGSQWASDSDVDVTLTQSGGNFVVVDKDDTVETYAPVSAKEALLISIQARNGYTQAL